MYLEELNAYSNIQSRLWLVARAWLEENMPTVKYPYHHGIIYYPNAEAVGVYWATDKQGTGFVWIPIEFFTEGELARCEE